MKLIKQSRETVPRKVVSISRAAMRPVGNILRMFWVVLFVPPPEQERIEEARNRASEMSGHFRNHGGT